MSSQLDHLKWHKHSSDEITGQTGWIPSALTWTYASASTFTVAGDVTAIYQKGTRLKFTQTTVKYAVVVASSYSAPSTTVTIAVNTDYTIANAAITSPFYSYANPPDYPTWYSWSPTLTGYSANPTNTVYRFKIDGCTLTFAIREATNGTSNATTLTITAPVTSPSPAKAIANMVWGGPAQLVDNSAAIANYGRWVIASGESTLTFGMTPGASGGFTASGGKRVGFCQGSYEI